MTCLDWVMKYSEEKRMIPETAEGMMYQRLVQLMANGSFDLVHATEDIPDKEFQKMVSFVFENMGEIEKLVKD